MLLGYGAKVGLGNMRVKAENRMVTKAGLYEDTYFMFLSDHGGIGYGHGGLSVDEMIVPWGIVGPKIQSGKMKEPNNTVNTAATILYLFKVKKPLSWIGEVPSSILK